MTANRSVTNRQISKSFSFRNNRQDDSSSYRSQSRDFQRNNNNTAYSRQNNQYREYDRQSFAFDRYDRQSSNSFVVQTDKRSLLLKSAFDSNRKKTQSSSDRDIYNRDRGDKSRVYITYEK